MKFKHFTLVLALFAFSSSLFAQQVTYSFSGFGGGLPSSAARVSMAASDTVTSQRIIVADDDEIEEEQEPDYKYKDEPTVNKNKKTRLIVTYVVLGAVVTAGIAVGAYYLTNESADCCSTIVDNFAEGCAEGCGESCGESCSDSSSEACSSSSSEACSSSSSSETTSCTTESIGNILKNGFQLIPIYVP